MPKTRDKNENIKDKLIETTCEMIAENNGASNINMRAVARRAGCAHTNVYSYFTSFNDLLYAAMLRTLEKLVIFTQANVGARASTKEHFPKFIYAQIDFAIQYPGLFRFIWLEALTEPVPDIIKAFGCELKNRFAELVYNCSDGKLTRKQALEYSVIVHSYMHGEICKMISGRDNVNFCESRENIKANIEQLMLLFIN
ncbi:MAG TPA: TetR/AcrR family transcriptional regulator [Ruminiclostridium sp.]|nr:TetR/AcrR family transcriptional regulator [Ruminiclostridium sp.]